MSEDVPTLALRSPGDLIGLVPYLIGHHPNDSVVAILLTATHRVRAGARADLTAPPGEFADQLRAVAATAADVAAVVLVGYGPAEAADIVTTVAAGMEPHLPVDAAYLVGEGRYRCVLCPCNGADGVVFDPTATVSAASATVAGLVALPSRADLVALADPDLAAQAAVGAAIAALPPHAGAGSVLLHGLLGLAERGVRLSDGLAARLAVALRDRAVCDAAYLATGAHMWQRDLWLDLTRRLPDAYVAAPASLVAWCAWQRGEEALADAAARRVLAVDPDHRMTRLICRALDAHLPAGDVLRALTAGGAA